jgi:hypothetical protein
MVRDPGRRLKGDTPPQPAVDLALSQHAARGGGQGQRVVCGGGRQMMRTAGTGGVPHGGG